MTNYSNTVYFCSVKNVLSFGRLVRTHCTGVRMLHSHKRILSGICWKAPNKMRLCDGNVARVAAFGIYWTDLLAEGGLQWAHANWTIFISYQEYWLCEWNANRTIHPITERLLLCKNWLCSCARNLHLGQ